MKEGMEGCSDGRGYLTGMEGAIGGGRGGISRKKSDLNMREKWKWKGWRRRNG